MKDIRFAEYVALRSMSQILSSVLPMLVLGFVVFGDNISKLFVSRHALQLSEADFQLLTKSFSKQHQATVTALEDSFLACLPSTIDNGTAKYYAEIYSFVITQNVEFSSQPGLPEVGSTRRAEIEAKFKSDRKKLVDEKSSAMIAVMSSSQRTRLEETDMTYSTASKAVEWSNCAMTGALQKLSKVGS